MQKMLVQETSLYRAVATGPDHSRCRERTASQIPSRAAHSADEGHEIVPNAWPLCSLGAPQEPSRNATLVPKASTTMQNRSFGHEMSAGKPASGSIRFGSRHTVAYDAASP